MRFRVSFTRIRYELPGCGHPLRLTGSLLLLDIEMEAFCRK